MSKDNPFRKAISSWHQLDVDDSTPIIDVPEETPSIPNTVSSVAVPEQKKRGRPATGKRSDNAWLGRTFYIQRETDLDAEEELLNLKRQGVELDKSELVDKLLAAWVQWRKGENLDLLLAEISPIQKSKNSKT
jgi:hypothetical protein